MGRRPINATRANGVAALMRGVGRVRQLVRHGLGMRDKATPHVAAGDAGLPPIHSLVPEAAPIELVSYYKSFSDYYPEAELQTKRWLVRNAQADWVALDIGANVGLYSILLSRLLTHGIVHAFEPTETIGILRTNLAAQGCANVTTHEVALGARSGEFEEPIYRIWGAAPETRSYRFTTLDDFVDAAGLQRLDCVKIDVDGFDLDVLSGAARSLARFDPWVIVELNHALATRGRSVGEALLWFVGQGYTEALVLDQENFLLRRANSATDTADGLRVRFDRAPILLPPAFVADAAVDGFFDTQSTLHGSATHENALVLMPGPRWNYAVSWARRDMPLGGPIVIEIDIEVAAGEVGIGCVDAQMTEYVGKEAFIEVAPGLQTVRLLVADATRVGHLILRNVEASGAMSKAGARAVRVARAKPAASAWPTVLDHRVDDFALDQVTGGNGGHDRRIEIVSVENLGAALGFPAAYVPEKILYRYGLEDFKTEVDEPGIYRYLYRQLAPRRHLEFGTWEGFGTLLCAESCNAEIWTVNLADGERDAHGTALYATQTLAGETGPASGAAGDAGERIGWRYRAAGHAGRVHQILCDSRQFPDAEFAPGWFDTILVDGGHTPDIVTSDTDRALALVRSGGVIIWHDFCPVPAALAASEAGRGVMQAWIEGYDRWRPQLARLFWLRPSWLLVGVKR